MHEDLGLHIKWIGVFLCLIFLEVSFILLDPLETIGISIIAGFIAARVFFKFKVPAVAAYVVIGVILGRSVLNIFSGEMLNQIGIVNDIALGFIAFIIGGELQWSHLKKLSKSVFAIVLLESLGAFFVVTTLVQFIFHQWSLSLLLGAISAATAPAATVMVIRELRASGNFTKTLLAIVAIDDAVALLIYSFASAIARMLLAPSCHLYLSKICLDGFSEIAISIVVGLIAAIIIAPVMRKLNKREDILVISVGTFMCITGLADKMGFSILLANMSFGLFLANITPIASSKIFDMVKNFAPPIFIAFFVTAGAHLRIDLISKIWFIGLVYLVARIIGKVLGASAGAIIGGADKNVRKYIGFGLISQVGVAIGLALVVNREFYALGPTGKHIADMVINVLLMTTIVTEVVGPILTRYALIKTGEAKIKS